MTKEIVVRTPGAFAQVFRQNEAARVQRVRSALYEAALLGAEVIAAAAPVDQGTLKASIRVQPVGADGTPELVIDAPHAAFVEYGTRPHLPPQLPILEWVRRHRQYFAGGGSASARRAAPKAAVRGGASSRRGRGPGRRLMRAVRRYVAGALRRLVRGLGGAGRGHTARLPSGRTPAGAPGGRAPAELSDAELVAIADAIRYKIAREGIAPTWFVRKNLPRLGRIVGAVVRRRIRDDANGE